MVFERSSGEAVGTLQATLQVVENTAYIAYVLFPSYWGRGYGFESVAWLMSYLQKEEAVQNIIAEIDTGNAKSVALIEKHGFTKIDTVFTKAGEDHIYLKVAGVENV